VGRQSALHMENSGFVAATLRRHISMFCGYQIIFSIRNPYINCFTNHFSIHKEIIQNVLERKDSMAVLPRPLALERACATFSPSHFGQRKIIYANHLP
jgi:hypothetical protein